MVQPPASLGPRMLSLFDIHICEDIPKNDRPDIGEIRSHIGDSMAFESSELYEIKDSPLLFSGLRYRSTPDGEMITCSYNPFAGNEVQDRANMLVVASSVSAVAWLQLTLISSYRTSIGGGMAFGEVRTDDVRFGGDAVDEALVLKSRRSSIYPRMAVSGDVERMFDELCARHHVKTCGKLGDAIETDSDGTPFINYLAALSILERIRTGRDEPIDPLTTMVQHRKGIDEMLRWSGDSIRSDDILKKRYGWLISYHNRIVRRSGVGDLIDPSVLERN